MLLNQLQHLLNRFVPVPDEWFKDLDPSETKKLLAPLPCDNYAALVQDWANAGIQWTDAANIAFSAMLAVVSSVKIRDDQVFLRVIGIAGSLKTTLCEAISVNRNYVYPMSAQRGFHSGWSAGGDNSLIPLIKDHTVVINEGDMLLKSPNCAQTLSEIRDMWSGVTRAHYRNGVMYEHEGLKTNFIIAGTPTLRELNESAAGDRFIDCIIYERAEVNERQLVRSVLRGARRNLFAESNGQSESVDSEEFTLAKQRTGGFVGWLRENIGKKLEELESTISDHFDYDIECLGLIVAKMRTRPMVKGENKTEAELHIRLSKQLAKLAVCLAVVLDKPTVDAEVMRRVAHLAEDTCYGNTFLVCKTLEKLHKGTIGLSATDIANKLKMPHEVVRKNLSILISLECIRAEEATAENGARRSGTIYRLTVQQLNLMNKLRSLMQVK